MNTTPSFGWLARRRLGAAEAIDALTAARRRAEKEPAPKVERLSPWTKALTGGVALIVLAGAGVIAAVVVGTQIGFYRTKMHSPIVDFSPLPLPTLDLTVFTPVATEGVVWMCTLMAVVLVILNRPSGLWTRSMWAFSGINAFVNTFSAITINNDFLHGVITGGLSITGPFVVHLFVIWVRHIRTGRTLTEARIETTIRWAAIARVVTACALAVLDHVVHPVTAVRTISVWRTYRGITYSQAWWIASKPLREKTRARLAAPPKPAVDAHPDAPVQDPAAEPPKPPVQDRVHGGVLTAVRADDSNDEQEMLDTFLTELDDDARIWDAIDAQTKTVLSSDLASGNDNARTGAAHPAAQVKNIPSAPVRTPAKKRGRTARMKRSARNGSTVPARDLVAAEYYRRKHAGEPVDGDGVNLSDIARQFGTSRTTVSKTFRECANGTRPDPNPNRK